MQLRKRAAMAAAAAALAATTITGCSGSLDTEAVVMTVGDEEVTLGVANFYARMTQAQYETYYLSMMSSNGMTMTAEDILRGLYGEYHPAIRGGRDVAPAACCRLWNRHYTGRRSLPARYV